jgi:hypothetical protein
MAIASIVILAIDASATAPVSPESTKRAGHGAHHFSNTTMMVIPIWL